MADGTEIVKLKTIVNLKSRQAGFRAKKRCGRGESRETEGRGRRKLRQRRKGRQEKRGGGRERKREGAKLRVENRRVRGGRMATRVERGGDRRRMCRRENAESHRTAAHPLPYVSSVPIPQNKSFRKGDGGAGKGDSPFSKGCHPSPAISSLSLPLPTFLPVWRGRP